ncbi:hypothetical protein PSU4_27650 [Pseudonocardia sulfidoxydans NBRC 16205]|uniref:Uncharacterized protein n=1 Tax=Pseudonocardia sulfidoxydans NBRC 16205 TaxID=1223511 RepID=A0A511DGA3_9PSEU|nr:hypothetical protein [Pseudonocardia sulfidoxydans]GEL23811.1 hypothetical protein PSU4_27650 [Pseudonocardia sulfidoxydans NBRC 16205]
MVSPFSAEALAPLGVPIGWLVVAGVVLVVAVVCVVVVLRRRRRRIAEGTTAALTAPAEEPVPGEPVVPGEPARTLGEPVTAGSEAGAAPEEAATPEEPAMVSGNVSVAPSVTTVGDLAALRGGRPVVVRSEGRDPDTTPLPVSSDILLQRASARRASTSVGVRVPDRGVAATAAAEEPADDTNVAAPWLRVDLTLADDAAAGPEAGRSTTGDATVSAGDGPGAGAPGAGPHGRQGEPRPVAAQPESTAGAVLRAVPSPAPDAADEPAGAGRTLADAVANALANRAAADRTRRPQPGGGTPADAGPDSAGPDRAGPDRAAPDGVARDRLLAVLLEDPDRAVGATVELDRVRGQLDRLVEAVRHEQDALAGLVERLASAGLDDAQIARLAGIPVGEVATLRAAES